MPQGTAVSAYAEYCLSGLKRSNCRSGELRRDSRMQSETARGGGGTLRSVANPSPGRGGEHGVTLQRGCEFFIG